MDLPFHEEGRRNRPGRVALRAAEFLAEGDFERRAIASRRRWRTIPASSAAPNSRKGMLQIASTKIHSLFNDIGNPEIFRSTPPDNAPSRGVKRRGVPDAQCRRR